MVSQSVFKAQFTKLTLGYPARPSSAAEGAAQTAAWWGVFNDKHWVTDAMFTEAVSEILATVPGYLPAPAQVLAVCQVLDDESKGRAAGDALPLPALPAPGSHDPAAVDLSGSPPKGFTLTREWWAGQVAVGRARQRARNLAIYAWRKEHSQPIGEVPDDLTKDILPTVEQVAAALENPRPERYARIPDVAADLERLHRSDRYFGEVGLDLPPWTDVDEAALIAESPHLRTIAPSAVRMRPVMARGRNGA